MKFTILPLSDKFSSPKISLICSMLLLLCSISYCEFNSQIPASLKSPGLLFDSPLSRSQEAELALFLRLRVEEEKTLRNSQNLNEILFKIDPNNKVAEGNLKMPANIRHRRESEPNNISPFKDFTKGSTIAKIRSFLQTGCFTFIFISLFSGFITSLFQD